MTGSFFHSRRISFDVGAFANLRSQSTVYAIAEKVSLKLEWVGQTLTKSSRLQIFLERSGALNRREWTTQHL